GGAEATRSSAATTPTSLQATTTGSPSAPPAATTHSTAVRETTSSTATASPACSSPDHQATTRSPAAPEASSPSPATTRSSTAGARSRQTAGTTWVWGGPGDDVGIIVDDNPVCGVPSGRSGNDELFGDDGDDQLHGDSLTDTGNPVFDSGSGND